MVGWFCFSIYKIRVGEMRYKVTNIHKNKTLNMRIWKYPLIVIIFLLSLTVVRSANITFEIPIIIGITQASNKTMDHITAFSQNNKWFIDYAEAVGNGHTRLATYDSDFTNRLVGWTDISIAQTYYGSSSINIYNSTHGYGFYDSGQSSRIKFYFLLANSDSYSTAWTNTDNHPNSCGGAYYVNSYSSNNNEIVARYVDCNKGYYTTSSTSNTLYIPSAYTNPQYFHLYYDSSTGKYFLFYVNPSSTFNALYVSIFNSSTLTANYYLKTIPMTNSEDATDITYPSFTSFGNGYYLAYNVGNQTRISAYTFDNSNNAFNLVWSELHTPSNVNLINNITSTPFMYYSTDFSKIYLFYTVWSYATPTSNLGLFAEEQSTFCGCLNWVTSYVNGIKKCVNSYVEQTRTCYPSACDSEFQYIFDSDCNSTGGQPQLIQNYKTTIECQSCQDAWQDPKATGTSKCLASILIPTNCTNITVTASLIPDVELSTWGLFSDNNFYNALVCSSNSECNYQANNLCSSINQTFSSNTTASAGQLANGQFQIEGSQCKDTFWLKGWTKYRATGSICYSCSYACGGNKCMTYGTKTYSVPEYADCNTNTSCMNDGTCWCEYGCSNGICQSNPSALGTYTQDPFTYIIDITHDTFSAPILSAISLFASLGVAITTYAWGKKEMNLPIIVFLAFTIFFTTIGWLSSWIGIVISIGIVLLLSRSLWMKT